MKALISKHFKLLLVIAIVLNILYIFIFQPACPWKKNFNIECAGCGLTRMFISLYKLDIYQAFRYNPLMFCLLVIFIIYGLYILICKIIHKKYYKIKEREMWIILVLVILFMILRNIPGLEYLKPTVVR